MKDYVMIKKTDILVASTIKYSHLNNNGLVIDEEYNSKYYTYDGDDTTLKCYLKKIVFIDKHFIDIDTGDELFLLPNEHGLVKPPIYKNTIYIVNIYKAINVSDSDLTSAINAYKNFNEKQQLIKSKKLIPFQQERIY